MESLKIYDVKSIYITTVKKEYDFSSNSSIYLGKTNLQECRCLVEFNLEKLKELRVKKDSIEKIEFCLYVDNVKLDARLKEYIIEIIINSEDKKLYRFEEKSREDNYSLYNVINKFENKYVNFDITKIACKDLIDNKISIACLAISEGGLLKFLNEKSNRSPFLKVTYKREKTEDVLGESKSYGYIVSESESLVKYNKYKIVKWDFEVQNNKIIIGEDNIDIEIFEKGVYQVDYSLNIRAEGKAYMFLRLNESEVKYSFVEISSDDHIYSGHIILKIDKNKSILNLCVIGKTISILELGMSGNIRIIKI